MSGWHGFEGKICVFEVRLRISHRRRASHFRQAATLEIPEGAGVIGVVTMMNPASMEIPWSRFPEPNHPAMDLAGQSSTETSRTATRLGFQIGRGGEAVAGRPTRCGNRRVSRIASRYPFCARLHFKGQCHGCGKKVESANLVGKLRVGFTHGKNEFGAFRAHDHIGSARPSTGDKFTRAMDDGVRERAGDGHCAN